MESAGKRLLKLLLERDPTSPEFRSEVRAVLGSPGIAAELPNDGERDLWRDVFVQQKLPWGRFLQSALLHVATVALLYGISLAWLRQQHILDRAAFDRSSLVTYSPEEYLPPLDTGATERCRRRKREIRFTPSSPSFRFRGKRTTGPKPSSCLPISSWTMTLSCPTSLPPEQLFRRFRWMLRDAPLTPMVAPEVQVVAPAPDVQFAPDRVVQAAMKSDVIAPPPELRSPKGRVGQVDIGPSQVVAPAPQLTLAEQHSLGARARGHLAAVACNRWDLHQAWRRVAPVTSGRLIALGIHPVAPTGPVAVPGGNRRGTFAATPQGKPGASGTPDLTGSKLEAKGCGRSNSGQRRLTATAAWLRVPAGVMSGGGRSRAKMASLSSVGARPGARIASPVSGR